MGVVVNHLESWFASAKVENPRFCGVHCAGTPARQKLNHQTHVASTMSFFDDHEFQCIKCGLRIRSEAGKVQHTNEHRIALRVRDFRTVEKSFPPIRASRDIWELSTNWAPISSFRRVARSSRCFLRETTSDFPTNAHDSGGKASREQSAVWRGRRRTGTASRQMNPRWKTSF